MSSEERRAPGTSRMPFEGLVEVGGALGPSFEAQAVNVSEDGMLLRTAYLPEAGQPLTCRFDAGSGGSVLASGEVVWTQGAERGGEFAIRFTDMDPESVDSLKRLCGLPANPGDAAAGGTSAAPNGAKVRLHIEGLASPMRAKIRESGSSEVRVGSDLGFLKVGKPLELEDATSGHKRPACIDRVEVEVDPASHVPQLVVTLRYAEAGPSVSGSSRAASSSRAPAASGGADAPRASRADDLSAIEEAGAQMKGTVARSLARIGPAAAGFAQRAKTTLALLAARARTSKATEEGTAPRRTTAPAPGGGLHAEGKKVVRGEAVSVTEEVSDPRRIPFTRRNAAIAGAVMTAAVLGALALKRGHHDAPADPTAAAPEGAAAASATPAPLPATTAGAEATPAATPGAAPFPPAIPAAPAAPTPAVADSLASNDDADDGARPERPHHIKVTPFGNGPVHHGNVLRLRMDGPIESIEGAQLPTGFTVKIPGHKSLEAAGPLASRDSRIAGIKVENGSAGAELSVTFKDGVPNYQVRASGESLVIALAPAGELAKADGKSEKTVARKDDKGETSGKHHKAHHKKD